MRLAILYAYLPDSVLNCLLGKIYSDLSIGKVIELMDSSNSSASPFTASKVLNIAKEVLLGPDENRDYGNLFILNEFANVPIGTPIVGRIQHGSVFGEVSWMSYKNNLMETFVWAKESQTWAETKGWRNFHAIGAPWLYLLKMSADAGWELFPANQTNSKIFQELWVYGFHSVMLDGAVDANLESFLRSASLSEAKDKLVLLGPVDFMKLKSANSSYFNQLNIVTLGNRRDSSTSNSHLFRLFHLLNQTKVVVADYPTTLVFYALSLGVTVKWLHNASFEHGFNLAKKASNANVIEMISREVVSPAQGRDVSLSILGVDSIKTSGELMALFGWTNRGLPLHRRISSTLRIALRAPRSYFKAV